MLMTTQETVNWRNQPNDAWDDADYRNEAWLRQKYRAEGLTGSEIGDLCDVCDDTVYKWLDKHDIETRGKNEGRRNWIDPSDELIEAIEGMLLGDGYMHRPNAGGGAYYQERDIHLEYVRWLRDLFDGYGLEGWVSEDSYSWRFTSHKVMDLVPLWERWYPNDSKEMPKDLELTPAQVYFWFIGDGVYSNGKQQDHLVLTGSDLSDGFEHARDQLRDAGLTCEVISQGIGIWRESHGDFFDYILQSGYGVPPGYEYKFTEC